MSLIELIDQTTTTAVKVRPGITIHVKALLNSQKMALAYQIGESGELHGDRFDRYMELVADCITTIDGCEDEITAAGGLAAFLIRIKDWTLQRDINRAVLDHCTITRDQEKN